MVFAVVFWFGAHSIQDVVVGFGGEFGDNVAYQFATILASWIIAWIVASALHEVVRGYYMKRKSLTEMFSGQ